MMLIDSKAARASGVRSAQRAAAAVDTEVATIRPTYAPRGALLLAGISVGLVFAGWLLFYFLLFMPRGPIG
jgi:hypothetical protein